MTIAEKILAKGGGRDSVRRDPNFVINARTDAGGPLGLDEAIRRPSMYAEAGADCLFADALLSVKDIERVVMLGRATAAHLA
jgi:2-methylisocitrate lyase-like PEP mutase family enzyme